MSEKRVVRPRGKSVAAKTAHIQPETMPGDLIELGITGEVTNKRGQKFWLKAGLTSQHRDGETSVEAQERVQKFVIESVEALQEEYLS